MNRILMSLELMENTTDGYLMVYKGTKYNVSYKVITDKIRHRLNEPTTLDTLIELYEEIPNFIKEQKEKK
jgi:hypothetical protein